MKKELFFVCCIGIILVLCVSVVSAGWWSDFWGKLTGEVTTGHSKDDGDGGGDATHADSGGSSGSSDASFSYSDSGGANSGSFTKEDIETHRICAGESCITVDRPGEDECTYDYQCVNQEYNNSCEDSDGGIIFWLFGAVSGYEDGEPYNYNDGCVSPLILRERYCDGNTPLFIDYHCEFGCNSGMCFNGTLNDTTNPDSEIFEIEYVFEGGERQLVLRAKATDYESGLRARSYSFKGPFGSGRGGSHPCGGNDCVIYVAQENPEPGTWEATVSFLNNAGLKISETKAFVVPPTSFNCLDSDGGKDYFLFGRVNGFNQNGYFDNPDECVFNNETNNTNLLLEYYCDNTVPPLYSSELYVCGNNAECINGECVKKTALEGINNLFKDIFG